MGHTKLLQIQPKNVLITGGHGTLGTKLNGILQGCYRPTSAEMDIRENLMHSRYINSIDYRSIETVIHCAAIKNEKCTNNRLDAMLVNIVGTSNVVLFCKEIGAKLVYISTDYVFRGDRGNYKVSDEVGPCNYYGETKLAAEYVVKSIDDYLIVRLSFFPDIFPYRKAFVDQLTTRITASEAAINVVKLIEERQNGVHHISGVKRSVYDYAVATSHGNFIEPIYLSEDGLQRPKDTSLE